MGRTDDEGQSGAAIKERVGEKTKEPSLYAVVLLNDDYTPMPFVVDVLEEIFQKSPAEAYRIMMQVHVNGRGVAASIHGKSRKPKSTRCWREGVTRGIR